MGRIFLKFIKYGARGHFLEGWKGGGVHPLEVKEVTLTYQFNGRHNTLRLGLKSWLVFFSLKKIKLHGLVTSCALNVPQGSTSKHVPCIFNFISVSVRFIPIAISNAMSDVDFSFHKMPNCFPKFFLVSSKRFPHFLGILQSMERWFGFQPSLTYKCDTPKYEMSLWSPLSSIY